MPTARRNDLLMALTAAVLVVIDQLSKHWIVSYFTPPPQRAPIPVPLLGNVLDIEYVQNIGVAFSLLAGQTVLFIFIGLAIVVIGTLYWRMRDSASLPLKLTFGLILGGAAGNLIDRFTRGYVVDFIHFHLDVIGFDFAVFNLADSGITIGVLLLAVLLWLGGAQTKRALATPPNQGADDATTATAATPASAAPRERGAESAPRVRNRTVSGR